MLGNTAANCYSLNRLNVSAVEDGTTGYVLVWMNKNSHMQ